MCTKVSPLHVHLLIHLLGYLAPAPVLVDHSEGGSMTTLVGKSAFRRSSDRGLMIPSPGDQRFYFRHVMTLSPES